jgi:hyperosmotically inducible periplasmic protein
MNRRESVWTLGLVASAAVALACTTGESTRAANASPAPYASPSGDVVDKTRAGAEAAGEKAKDGAEKAGEAIEHAAKEVEKEAKPVAKDVGEKIKEGAQETGRAIDATKQHLDVKAALLADKAVDASHIDIDTDKDAKILYLRGTVPTAAQKAKAERIARDKADGFTVRNELTVMAVPKK